MFSSSAMNLSLYLHLSPSIPPSPPVHLSSGFCLSACPDCPRLFSLLSSFSSLLCPPFSLLPLCLRWLDPLSLSLYMALKKRVPRMDSPVLANGSRLVSLCKYLHRGIIDGPTHSRWSPALLQATLGQRMTPECSSNRGRCDMTQHNIT